MKKHFLDTSVIVAYLRGKKEAISILEELEGDLTSSFVCLAELYEGVFRVKDQKKVEQGVLDFFAGLSEVYGLDQSIAQLFGKVRAQLKKQGQVIEDLDIFLAATCLAYDLVLVTSNPKHFSKIKGLTIRSV